MLSCDSWWITLYRHIFLNSRSKEDRQFPTAIGRWISDSWTVGGLPRWRMGHSVRWWFHRCRCGGHMPIPWTTVSWLLNANVNTFMTKLLSSHRNAQEIHNFGGGRSKPILLDQVKCTGAEHARHCRHAGWGVHNCNSDENVGIRCAWMNRFTTFSVCCQ